MTTESARTETTGSGLPLQACETVVYRGIAVTPLFPTRDPGCAYVSLAAATRAGLTVTEVTESGVVGALIVTNAAGSRVLLYDGEEVAGAKQNRILNLSVLVEAGGTLTVPVSCVEAGRWRRETDVFHPAGRVPSADVRRSKAESLHHRPTTRGLAQDAVWDAVSRSERAHGFASPTRSHGDLIEHQRPRIEDLARAFAPSPGQCGMILGMDGRITCMDAVSRPDVWADLHEAMTTGYMLDALAAPDRAAPPEGAAAEFLGQVAAAPRTEGPGVGLGTDLRIAGPGVLGSGLALDGELLQITAFRTGTADGGAAPIPAIRIARPSHRQM